MQETLPHLQLYACTFMTGLIWVIQVVHYPSFEFIPESEFAVFHRFHSRRISWLVGPVMTFELIIAIALLFYETESFWIANLALLSLTWLITGFVSVPLHAALEQRKTQAAVQRLIVTNWARTLLWTLRSIALLVAIA